jgi:hypothetical protein
VILILYAKCLLLFELYLSIFPSMSLDIAVKTKMTVSTVKRTNNVSDRSPVGIPVRNQVISLLERESLLVHIEVIMH